MQLSLVYLVLLVVAHVQRGEGVGDEKAKTGKEIGNTMSGVEDGWSRGADGGVRGGGWR